MYQGNVYKCMLADVRSQRCSLSFKFLDYMKNEKSNINVPPNHIISIHTNIINVPHSNTESTFLTIRKTDGDKK